MSLVLMADVGIPYNGNTNNNGNPSIKENFDEIPMVNDMADMVDNSDDISTTSCSSLDSDEIFGDDGGNNSSSNTTINNNNNNNLSSSNMHVVNPNFNGYERSLLQTGIMSFNGSAVAAAASSNMTLFPGMSSGTFLANNNTNNNNNNNQVIPNFNGYERSLLQGGLMTSNGLR